jgi:hypothetical protein
MASAAFRYFLYLVVVNLVMMPQDLLDGQDEASMGPSPAERPPSVSPSFSSRMLDVAVMEFPLLMTKATSLSVGGTCSAELATMVSSSFAPTLFLRAIWENASKTLAMSSSGRS